VAWSLYLAWLLGRGHGHDGRGAEAGGQVKEDEAGDSDSEVARCVRMCS
jgi:hypothetical protein